MGDGGLSWKKNQNIKLEDFAKIKVLEKAVKELKVVGAYNQNFENKPSQLLNKSINEK